MNTQDFQDIVWDFAKHNTRKMPWRENVDPYYILVSELMLQQTQVERVIPKFNEFIEHFPTIDTLAKAQLSEVLVLWSGLGYNRRAKFLWQAAQKVVSDFSGVIPSTKEELVTLPGVGVNTAGAIVAYAFNQSIVFVETNIRTVYFYHFFEDYVTVTDREILEKASETIDTEQPREWHWALMDYGSYLKKQGAGRLQRSAHYKKQSPLKGSVREMRGRIILALKNGQLQEEKLCRKVNADERFKPALKALIKEGFIKKIHNSYSLT